MEQDKDEQKEVEKEEEKRRRKGGGLCEAPKPKNLPNLMCLTENVLRPKHRLSPSPNNPGEK